MLRRYVPISAVSALSLLAAGCGAPPQTADTQPYTVTQTYTVIPPQAPDERTVVVGPTATVVAVPPATVIAAPSATVVYVPTAPPAPIVEVIPAAPSTQVYWVPGHWRWSATADGKSGYVWVAGYYVQRPSQTVVWQSGHWQQSSAGYFWVEGHWQ